MFFGATPRHSDEQPSTPRSGYQVKTLESTVPLSAELQSILGQSQSPQRLVEALLSGVESAPFGPERLRKCEERRDDAVAVLVHLQRRFCSLGLSSNGDKDDPFGLANGVRSRDEVALASVVGSCDAVLKAIAYLEAHALLSKRACRQSQSSGTPRGTPRGTPSVSPRRSPPEALISPKGSAEMLSPRGSPEMLSPRGSLQTPLPPGYADIHREAHKLRNESKQQLQSSSGVKRDESWFKQWFFDVMCEACTTRQDAFEHQAQVSDVLTSLYSRAAQAAKGDVLCCAPLQVDLDGVRYRALPEEDGRVLPKAVKRGKMVLVKGRQGDWIFNSNGFLPLKHPVDGSALFLFDHKKATVLESEESSGSDDQRTPRSSTPRSSKSKKNKSSKQPPRLQGNMR